MTQAPFPVAPLGPMIAKQIQTECLRLLRLPAFDIASIVLPIIFSHSSGPRAPTRPYLPTYHFAQLAWTLFGAGSESVVTAILWLAGYSAAFLIIALRAYWREEKLKFT